MGAYDPAGRETILALVKVLRHLGDHVRRAAQREVQRRSGAAAGQRSAVHHAGRREIENIEAGKVKKMLSICPHCVRTMGTDWREAGQTVEIEHHSELLARHKTRLPMAADDDAREGGLSRSLLSGPLSRRLR